MKQKMKIIGIIPARFQSSRFPGKPLADIHGKPMLWWVYQKVCRIEAFSAVYCAIDDERIQKICEELKLNYIYTRDNHPDHISRIQEVSERIKADYYVCINGDEPLITDECIIPVLPKVINDGIFFGGAMRSLYSPAEVIDPANIKIVISIDGRCIYLSRTPVPYPKGSLNVDYKKYVGVECFNKKALDFFVNTPMGSIEKTEDIDHLRFIEHGIDLHFTQVKSDSISVDTPKDLDFVRAKMSERLEMDSIERIILQESFGNKA